jgi:hypothetical protein
MSKVVGFWYVVVIYADGIRGVVVVVVGELTECFADVNGDQAEEEKGRRR